MRKRTLSDIGPSDKKYFVGRYLLWWLIVSFIVTSILGLFASWQYRIDAKVEHINNRHQLMVTSGFNSFKDESLEVGLHASEMRDSFFITEFVVDRTDELRRDVNRVFSNALSAHGLYDYIHILDVTGKEISRVDRIAAGILLQQQSNYKDYSQSEPYQEAVRLLDNQVLVSGITPSNSREFVTERVTPGYQIITPIVVSGKRYGYLIYHCDGTFLFDQIKTALLNDVPKSEIEIFANGGVWSASFEAPEWAWEPLPSDSKEREMFGQGDTQPIPVMISDGRMQFVDRYGISTVIDDELSVYDPRRFRDGQELLSSANRVSPVVLRLDYEGMLNSINLSKHQRWLELVAVVFGATICALVVRWIWLKLSGWVGNRRLKQQELEDSANRDFLTGAMTRKAFLDYALSHFSVLPNLSQPSVILMLDIDSFKEVNDTYGHLVGDTVLKEMVTAFQIGFREHDRIARWGGDEFVLLLTNVESSQILGVAERIRRRVAQMQYKIEEAVNIQVTASIGAASIRGGSDMDAISVMDSIRTADKALYRAKKGGGNRVAMISEDPGSSAYGLSITSDVS